MSVRLRREPWYRRGESAGKSGGGGSRTRVREWILPSLYVRRSPFGSLPDGSANNPARASHMVISSVGPVAWTSGPARLVDAPAACLGRAGRGTDGLLSKPPVPDRCWHLCGFRDFFRGSRASARNSEVSRPVEAVSPPLLSINRWPSGRHRPRGHARQVTISPARSDVNPRSANRRGPGSRRERSAPR